MEEIKKLYEDLLPWEREEFDEWMMKKLGIMLLHDCHELWDEGFEYVNLYTKEGEKIDCPDGLQLYCRMEKYV